MEWLGYIVFGLIVGILARLLMPGRDPAGFIVTALLGMAGALVGTFLGRVIWGATYQGGWIAAIIGAVLLLALYRMFTGPRRAVHV
jgi:uncharacterized membrane protein YeaQ/YmgE (transglycosylase-associated protein family)